jgi:hypothetical protein
MKEIPMRSRTILLRIAAVAVAIASSACHHAERLDLDPDAMRELVVPAIGQTEAAVVALNGGPDHREKADDGEMWVYARTLPAVGDLRSRSAIVWFRDGVVVRVGVSGGFSAPNPTFPLAGAAADES